MRSRGLSTESRPHPAQGRQGRAHRPHRRLRAPGRCQVAPACRSSDAEQQPFSSSCSHASQQTPACEPTAARHGSPVSRRALCTSAAASAAAAVAMGAAPPAAKALKTVRCHVCRDATHRLAHPARASMQAPNRAARLCTTGDAQGRLFRGGVRARHELVHRRAARVHPPGLGPQLQGHARCAPASAAPHAAPQHHEHQPHQHTHTLPSVWLLCLRMRHRANAGRYSGFTLGQRAQLNDIYKVRRRPVGLAETDHH